MTTNTYEPLIPKNIITQKYLDTHPSDFDIVHCSPIKGHSSGFFRSTKELHIDAVNDALRKTPSIKADFALVSTATRTLGFYEVELDLYRKKSP